jgi:hypothetical protein
MIELIVIAALAVLRYYTHRRIVKFADKTTQTEMPFIFYSELINIDDDFMSLGSPVSDLSNLSFRSTHFELELSDCET